MATQLRDLLQAALEDSYRIERELTGGGMSRLYLATERSLGRKVVIKLLPPELAGTLSAQRFQREIALAANLAHPHILPVLAAGVRGELAFYVMPFVDGESVRERLRRDGRLPVGDAVRWLAEVADALAFAHAHDVLHRDVKPDNILLEGGHAVLADFGIARAIERSSGAHRLTAPGTSVGTPGYMSPEQFAGDPAVDPRSDIFALAIVGYEMLAGEPPFRATALGVALPIGTPRPLRALRADVPLPLDHLIARGLAADPADRPQTAAELRDGLTRLAAR